MAFNKDKPSADTSLRTSNPEILANQSALQSAMDNEHEFTGTAAATQDGYHTQGSARCFSQAGAPATKIDGNNFESTDLGSLWVDTDDNALYILTATSPTWTPVSAEVIAVLLAANRVFAGTLGVTGDFAVNTDKFTVAAASGNAVVAGTLDVASTLDIATTIPITATLDEDDMVSDSATAVSTQQSIKAYADTKETSIVTQATADLFASRDTTDTDSGNLVAGSTYQAECSGFLVLHGPSGTGEFTVRSDTNATPSLVVGYLQMSGNSHNAGHCCVPILKDHYVKVTEDIAGNEEIQWVPFGTGGLVKQ